jgi:hypothetical protein
MFEDIDRSFVLPFNHFMEGLNFMIENDPFGMNDKEDGDFMKDTMNTFVKDHWDEIWGFYIEHFGKR